MVPGTRIDSDTNDALAAFRSNNTPETAQWLTNTGRVGGYVAADAAGEPGATQPGGDVIDGYRLQLDAGQWVNLYISDPDRLRGDLDLELYDAQLNYIGGSYAPGDSPTESLSAPATGEYFAVVIAYADDQAGIASASNYILEVGTTAAAQHAMHTAADILPREAVVLFHEQRAKALGPAADRARHLGMRHAGGAPGRAMRFVMSEVSFKAAPLGALGLIPPAYQDSVATLRAIKRVAADPTVSSAEPNPRRHLRRIPNDPLYNRQTHYPLINLPGAWDITTGSPEVLVAIIDTGVLINHPDLAANLDVNDPDGVDFISQSSVANDGDGADQDADDAGDAGNPDGSASFHGTHVAGTVAAVGDNGTGVSGVCWTCQIMPLRALGVDGGSGFDINQAVRYAAGLANDYGILPARPADIINMSLGGGGFSNFEQSTFNDVREAGVIVVAAAGNAGTSDFAFPASYEGVISVAAIGPDRQRAPYSQFNTAVDVAAPGGNARLGREAQVASTIGFGRGSPADVEFGFGFLQGTSMATPHMAGVVALMKALHPGLTPAVLDSVLIDGSIVDDAGLPGRDDEFGFGIINAAKAVQVAQALASGQAVPESPRLAVAPSTVNFGAGLATASFEARNVGTGALSINGVDPATVPPWLNVTDQGGGRFLLSADRALLPGGLSQARLRVRSSANDVDVPVRIEKLDADRVGEDTAGQHYVLLLPLDESLATLEVAVQPVAGAYPFRFENVPPGDYVLAAGTDMDNDFIICDDGEACAMFPANGDQRPLRVDGDVGGLELMTDYDFEIRQAVAADGLGAASPRGVARRR